MEIKLNQKIIKERCGAVSYKKGEAFYRHESVTVEEVTSDALHATVKGMEDFHVHLKKSRNGFTATCSCPSLSSFQKDCQHIAAVLITWQNYQQEQAYDESVSNQPIDGELSEGLLELFGSKPKPKSGQQRHFENRTILETAILCQVLSTEEEDSMFGIGLQVASEHIDDIRGFLVKISEGRNHVISKEFTYDPIKFCFDSDTDAVIQQLIQLVEDEKMYSQAMEIRKERSVLPVPASSWKRLEPLLVSAPKVKLLYARKTYHDFHLSDEKLPLTFEFNGTEEKGYRLIISGLSSMVILKDYDTVLFSGKVIAVKRGETERLYELKQMLDKSRTNEIAIPRHGLKYYMEKLLPHLRKMGEVHLSGEITAEIQKTPLKAKLYLDRVKHRLLAGLEFHYENVVINPLDNQQPKVGAMIIRDMEKEEEILQLMMDSQFNQTESGYYIQNEELEYNFLYHELPKLQNLVQVYATTAVRTRILPKTIIPKIKVRHFREKNHFLEFTFSIDGITEEEIKGILAAMEEKRKYFRLRNGVLFSLETKEMEQINRFLREVPVQDDEWEKQFKVPVVEGLRLLNYFDDSDTVSMEASFREFLEQIQQPKKLKFDVPEQLDGILRNYQKQGFNWMKTLANFGFGGILADDMGLGKTIQSIAFILSELSSIREKKQPALIVCPSSVTYNWQSEIMRFAPNIQMVIIDGSKAERIKLQSELDNIDVVVTSYPLLRSDVKWYEEKDFHVVFFDEAQVFKNALTQTARVVKKLKATHRFALTGTPMENNLEELWSIFHVVFPELFLGLREYSELTNKQISRRIRPFMLRRIKEDVLGELPEKRETVDTTELLPEQKKLYASYLAKLRHKTLRHLDKDTIRKNRIKILAGLTRLRQICCHPALFVDGYEGTSAKFEQLMGIVEEARLSGRRLLIFSQFTKMLHLIGQELASRGISHFYLDGQTPSEERLALCNRFNGGERDIFLISLKAGGTGLNLTGADTVIFYDSWWNPAVEEQAADRAHRMGQKHTVQVIKLVSKGTIEEKMNVLQDRKRHLIEEVIDSKDAQTGTLTDEDIKDLLS
ncbi:DEAD/DEAH box helicase [Paucisalibacillus globulus]|uniref:DEAD/DEAH box helicase n=1 Tax=Paucisalibacillus globulus TaxID=351095 RepID=UPI00040E00FE|nr:DEAD/DEAH box helicase [Paucisalibacillus globulus]